MSTQGRNVETVTLDVVEARLAETLAAAAALGVRWKGSRFDSYLDIIQRRPRHWRRVDLDDQAVRNATRLEWEASSQAQQLIDASQVWPRLDQTALADKLRKVFQGPALPPDKGEDDAPRNYLLELTTAGLLGATAGFEVELSRHAEDLRVVLPNLGTFLVECKRPSGPASFRKNLTKLRRQLRGRLEKSEKGLFGFGVVALDRLVGVHTEFLGVRDRTHLIEVLDNVTRRYLRAVERYARNPMTNLGPRVALFGLVFSGSMLLRDEELVCSVSQMGTFFPGNEKNPLGQRVARALSGHVENARRSMK